MKRKRPRPDSGRTGTFRAAQARAAVKAKVAEETALLGALELLRQRRAPYSDLVADIVGDTLEHFSPPLDRPFVELGAGTGQLRAWLPRWARERTVHTDPSSGALRALIAHAPDAHAAVATAERIPFGDGACAAVLALCVFDALTAAGQPAAINEIARVLPPGGRFVHFLDMATLLDAPFAKLAESGLVPIPNVFGDPADFPWPLDILLIKREWLMGLMDFALRTQHPLGPAFGTYFGTFLTGGRPFQVKQATDLFKAIASSGPQRDALAGLLSSASRLAFQWGYPAIDPLPFHSGKYLASVIETGFRESGAFQVELSEIMSKSVRRAASFSDPTRYLSLCVGHQRIMDHLPQRLLTQVTASKKDVAQPAPSSAARDEVLVEAGVFVFVATRL